MTRDEIIRLAQEAGWEMPLYWDESDGFLRRLERFAALVAESERQWFAQIINRIEMPALTRELILDVLKARQSK